MYYFKNECECFIGVSEHEKTFLVVENSSLSFAMALS